MELFFSLFICLLSDGPFKLNNYKTFLNVDAQQSKQKGYLNNFKTIKKISTMIGNLK